jgi:hypothetical protein
MRPFDSPVKPLATAIVSVEDGERVVAPEDANVEDLAVARLEIERPARQHEVIAWRSWEGYRLKSAGGAFLYAGYDIYPLAIFRDASSSVICRWQSFETRRPHSLRLSWPLRRVGALERRATKPTVIARPFPLDPDGIQSQMLRGQPSHQERR